MKLHLLLLSLALSLGTVASAQRPGPATPPPAMTLLAPTGVPAGPAEQFLPKGAIAHLQLNSLEKLAFDLEALVLSALPEEIVPLPLQQQLAQPHPLLGFMGLQTVKAPLDAALITGMTGVDITRPASATLYVGPGGPAYVVSLPVANYTGFTGILMNMTMARSVELTTVQGVTCYHLQPTQPNLPKHLYVVCSADRAYICTSKLTAGQFGSAAARLAEVDFIPTAIAKHAADDLVLCLDTGILKPFLPLLQTSFATLNPMQLQQFRAMIPLEVKLSINARLRSQSNFDSIDEFLDYAECFAVAGYEILAQDLVKLVGEAEGMSMALDINKTHQTMSFSVVSSQITPAKSTQPLDLAVVKPFLAQLPGDRNLVLLTGQAPRAEPSHFNQRWVPLVQQKMKAKSLASKTTESFLAYVLAIQPKQPMESLAPWTLTTYLGGDELVVPEGAESIDEWLRQLSQAVVVPAVRATIMPTEGKVLKSHLVRETRNAKRQQALANRYAKTASARAPFLSRDYSIFANELENDITRMSLWTTYRTQTGFFGYDEHELVNRRFVLYRERDDHLFIERGARDPRWLNGDDFDTATPVRESLLKLVDRAPAQVNQLQLLTSDSVIPELLALVASAEKAAHEGLDHYLAMAQAAYAKPGGEVDSEALLLAMPSYVVSLNRDVTSGKLYLVLFSGLTYPRSLLAPAVNACFAEVLAKAGSVGGSASYARTLPGQHELTYVQNSEGLALLIRSVGNTLFRTYFKTPEGQAALQTLIAGTYDAAAKTAPSVLLTNPTVSSFGGSM